MNDEQGKKFLLDNQENLMRMTTMFKNLILRKIGNSFTDESEKLVFLHVFRMELMNELIFATTKPSIECYETNYKLAIEQMADYLNSHLKLIIEELKNGAH